MMERTSRGRRSSLLTQAAQKDGFDFTAERNVAELVRQCQLPISLTNPGLAKANKPGGATSNVGSTRRLTNVGVGGLRQQSRAGSMESLYATPSVNRTPASRNFSRSKSPGKLGLSENKLESVAKNLKIPQATDKRATSVMAAMVSEFFSQHGFNGAATLENGNNKLTLNQYFDACRFALQLMMGEGFLDNLKHDDFATKLIELSQKFRYPAAITKSILKSPNSPHAWPTALTFLTFLCARVEAALTPIECTLDNPINEIKDPDMYAQAILTDSYCRLFHQCIRSGKYSLGEELESYRERLREMACDTPQTIQELNEIAEEKQRMLAEKEAEPDPRADLLVALANQNQTLAELAKKKEELKAKLRKCTDIGAVTAKRNTLLHKLEAAKNEERMVDEKIQTQKVNCEQRKKLVKEIEDMRLQREALEEINLATKHKLQNREQYVATSQKRFFDICGRLSVSNRFNEYLQRLELLKVVENMERLSNTPFSVEGLGAWLKDTKRIHRQTKALLCQLRDSVQEKNDTVKADIAFYLEKESKDESAKHEIEAKFQILRANKEKDLAAIKEEWKIQNRELLAKKALVEKLLSDTANVERTDNLVEELESAIAEKEALLKKHDLIVQEKAQVMEQIEQLNGPIVQHIHNKMIQHMDRRRQIIKDRFGIDIMKDDKKEE